jgi:hypothetical protein
MRFLEFAWQNTMKKNSLSPADKKLSRALAEALADIYARTRGMSFDDLLKSYRAVKKSFLPKVAENEFLTLETKRRVAERVLYSAMAKQCSLEVCRKFFNDLSRLGFTNLEQKSNVYLAYARHSAKAGHKRRGIRLLKQLETELENELRQHNLLIYRRLIGTVKDALSKLRLQE